MKDYYEILQVSPNADPEVIGAAYRRLARKYHPDVYTGPDAAERMRELNEAYEVLSDPAKRAEYDLRRGYAKEEGRGTAGQQESSTWEHWEQPLSRRVTWLWPAALGLGLVGAVGLVIAFASVGGGGSSGPSVTPVAASQGGPSIDFPVTEVDFGQVPLNTDASYAFEFSNVGDAPLQIEDVKVKVLEGC